MGPFAWLAGRWTPEFEYRDRLADEVEDIAYESTRIGTRRGFLLGVLVGAMLAVIAVGTLMANRLQTKSFPTTEQQESSQEVTTSPQPSSEEVGVLRQENEQLKRELARAKAAGVVPPRQTPAEEPKPPQPKTVVPAASPAKTVAKREVAVKPEEKANPPDSLAAQPIPSNCRKEGDCDPVGR